MVLPQHRPDAEGERQQPDHADLRDGLVDAEPDGRSPQRRDSDAGDGDGFERLVLVNVVADPASRARRDRFRQGGFAVDHRHGMHPPLRRPLGRPDPCRVGRCLRQS